MGADLLQFGTTFATKLQVFRIFKLAFWAFHFLRPFPDPIFYQRLCKTNDKTNKRIEMMRDSEPQRKYRFFFICIDERE